MRVTREEIKDRVEEILTYVCVLDVENDPSWPMKMESARAEVIELIDAVAGPSARVLKVVAPGEDTFSADKESFIAP